MIRDSLDLFNPRGRFTATATYYHDRPDGPEMSGQKFHYEYVNAYSKSYQRLFANVRADAGETAIRTDEFCDFRVNGYVVTQDGKEFRIQQVERDYTATPKQVMRLLGVPVSVHYLLRLIEVSNPWGIT